MDIVKTSLLPYLTWSNAFYAFSTLLFISFLSDVVSALSRNTEPKHSMGPAQYKPKQTGQHGRYFQSDLTRLWVYHRTWSPASGAPRAVIYLIHGIGEHCGRYDHVAAILAKDGFLVHALDHQGHGQSEGDRCYFERFSHLVDDVVQLIIKVKAAPSGTPSFILGHSMGGLITLHAAMRPELKSLLSGIILSGPALIFDPEVDSALNRFLAKHLSSILPKLPVQSLDPAKLCTDPEICVQYKRDPLLYTGGIRIRVGHELINAVEEARAFAKDISMSVLIQHGDADAICNIEGSRSYMSLLIGSADKTLIPYPNLFHEIYNESKHPDILQDTVKWLIKHI